MPQTLRTQCEPGGQWLWALLKRAGAPPSQTQPPAKNRVERTGDCVPVAGPGVVGPRWPGCAGLRVGGPCQEPRSRARVFWSSSLGPTARGGGPGTEATGAPKPCPQGQPHRGLWPAAAAAHGHHRGGSVGHGCLSFCYGCGLGPGEVVGPPPGHGGWRAGPGLGGPWLLIPHLRLPVGLKPSPDLGSLCRGVFQAPVGSSVRAELAVAV